MIFVPFFLDNHLKVSLVSYLRRKLGNFLRVSWNLFELEKRRLKDSCDLLRVQLFHFITYRHMTCAPSGVDSASSRVFAVKILTAHSDMSSNLNMRRNPESPRSFGISGFKDPVRLELLNRLRSLEYTPTERQQLILTMHTTRASAGLPQSNETKFPNNHFCPSKSYKKTPS